jgi:AmiR/NasT family two-component response regulator
MSGRRRLAIAFDSARARDALFSRLDGAAFELDCFDDGKALLEHCRTHVPDLVVLTLSGGERSPAGDWPSLGETPIVAIAENEADVAQALSVGNLAGLVVGPLSEQLVQAAIQVALQQLDRIQELQRKLALAQQAIDQC